MNNREIKAFINRTIENNNDKIIAIKQTADCVSFKEFTIIVETENDSYYTEKWLYDNFKNKLNIDINSIHFIM